MELVRIEFVRTVILLELLVLVAGCCVSADWPQGDRDRCVVSSDEGLVLAC